MGEPLHATVYIVADKPAKNNVRKDVPLVGTDSYKTTLIWLATMRIDITRVRLFNQSDNPFNVETSKFINKGVVENNIRVVALGKKAMNYLMEIGVDEFFVLPHPSAANRAQHVDISSKLEKCSNYIYNKRL